MPLQPAGPQIQKGTIPRTPLSPAELLRIILLNEVDARIVRGSPPVIVGPATNEQQQAGVVSVTDSGPLRAERYIPVVYPRLQIRCMAHAIDVSDRIGYHVHDILQNRHRQVVTDSTDTQWLVHRVAVLSGPSLHFDSQATWEQLMFVEMMVGREPVSAPTS